MSKQREIAFRHFMLNYFPNRDEIWALLCFLLSISIFMSCISRISNEFIWMASISPIVVSNNAFLSHHFLSSFSSSSFSQFYRNNVLISWRKIKLWTDTTWASGFFFFPRRVWNSVVRILIITISVLKHERSLNEAFWRSNTCESRCCYCCLWTKLVVVHFSAVASLVLVIFLSRIAFVEKKNQTAIN